LVTRLGCALPMMSPKPAAWEPGNPTFREFSRIPQGIFGQGRCNIPPARPIPMIVNLSRWTPVSLLILLEIAPLGEQFKRSKSPQPPAAPPAAGQSESELYMLTVVRDRRVPRGIYCLEK
jgi:hypothetical protein